MPKSKELKPQRRVTFKQPPEEPAAKKLKPKASDSKAVKEVKKSILKKPKESVVPTKKQTQCNKTKTTKQLENKRKAGAVEKNKKEAKVLKVTPPSKKHVRRNLSEELKSAKKGPSEKIRKKLQALKAFEEQADDSASDAGTEDLKQELKRRHAAKAAKGKDVKVKVEKAPQESENEEEDDEAEGEQEDEEEAEDEPEEDSQNEEDSEEGEEDEGSHESSDAEDDDEDEEEEEQEEEEGDQDEDDDAQEEEDEEMEKVEEKTKEGEPATLAVVAASSAAATQVVRNSVTNKTEWDTFNRAIKNRKTFPAEMSSYVLKNKNEVFNAWLDAGGQWDECKVIIERKQKSSVEGLSGWVAMKGKDIAASYGDTKAKVIFDSRKASGLTYPDEDFPDDDMERWYYMRKGKELTKREITEEEAKLSGTSNVDGKMLHALIDESEGIFKAGQVPTLQAASTAGQKALVDAMGEGGAKAVPKAKAKPKETEGAEVARPKTIEERAVDLVAELLSESSAARKKSMSLGSVNYAGELSAQLLKHAETLEKHYKVLQKATKEKKENESFYKTIFKKIEQDRKWYSAQ